MISLYMFSIPTLRATCPNHGSISQKLPIVGGKDKSRKYNNNNKSNNNNNNVEAKHSSSDPVSNIIYRNNSQSHYRKV